MCFQSNISDNEVEVPNNPLSTFEKKDCEEENKVIFNIAKL